MKAWNKILVAALMLVFGAAFLTACSGGGAGSLSESDDTWFTYWIYSGPGSSYYYEYEENPAVMYTETKTWGPENKYVHIDYATPAPGSEQDEYQRMYATDSLTDLLDGVATISGLEMYTNGYCIDLTDYVNQYMPNYKKMIEENDDLKKAVTINVDGEEKIVSIAAINEKPGDASFGFIYRRDWLVKYGTNPETGAAFTGGFTAEGDPDAWEDDVVFPSGETEPVYISDWEWMFGIYEKAFADLNITDSYMISMYYPGFTWSGGLCSSFGGGCPSWCVGEDGKVYYGGVTDAFRTYLECLNSWYEKGWLDPAFDQRTADAHYQIDQTSVRQGLVPMWYGVQSTLGGRMENATQELTKGIYTCGARMPINDVYGPDSCKNVIPDCTAAGGNFKNGAPLYVTKKAVEHGKDIATLCAYLDYFYTEEGAAIRSVGLTAEQAKASGSTFYEDQGLTNGAYTPSSEGEFKFKLDSILANDSGHLWQACKADKLPGYGYQIGKSIDNGENPNLRHSLDAWVYYPNIGLPMGAPGFVIDPEDSAIMDPIHTKLLNYLTSNAVNFIKAKGVDIHNDQDWADWCTMLGKYNYQKALDIYQPYVEAYGYRQP